MRERGGAARAVSIVIPCVDGLDLLGACLETLASACAEHPHEVVVVDNGSADGGRGFDALAGIRVVHHATNLGFAAGVNSGIRAASGELVMVLNNDTLCSPGMVDRMVRALDDHSGVGFVGPQSNCVKGAQFLPLGDEGLTRQGRAEASRMLAQSCGGRVEDVLSLSGLCLLGTASAWERVGLFDAAFPVGNFEDDDLCLQARREGLRLLIARDAYVHHLGNRTFTRLSIDYRDRYERNRRVMEEKWKDDPLIRGHEALIAGEPGLAEELAARAVRRFPHCPDVALLRWEIARATGRRSEELEHLTRFLAACPYHTCSSLELGHRLLEQGRVEAGRARLAWTMTHCHLDSATTADALLRLAEWCLKADLVQEAQSHFESALALDGEPGRVHIGLGICALALGRLDAAEREFRSALDETNPVAWMNLGITLWRSGRPEESVSCLTRAAEIAPDYRPARENLAKVLSSSPCAPGSSAAPSGSR